MQRQIALELLRAERLIPWIFRALRVTTILAAAWLLTHIVRRLLGRLRAYTIRSMDRRGEATDLELEKRAATIMAVLAKLASVVIWIVAVLMALNELTFNVQPLLASLGVAGLALGLGAQALIKDWLGGILILLEDQIRIGDAVTINGISGAVEEINLRTTVLRGENGAVHVISNGLISTISNMTRGYAYYVFEAMLAHGADVDRALRILNEVGAAIAQEEPFRSLILAPFEVMGVDRLAERGILLRARIKTQPSKQAIVGRELNRRVSAQWAAAGVTFPLIN